MRWLLVARGDMASCSFAFLANTRGVDDSWTEEDEEEDEKGLGIRGKTSRTKVVVRTLHNFSELRDVSVVTYPAYPQTSVDARTNLVSAEVRSWVDAEFVRQPHYTSRRKRMFVYGEERFKTWAELCSYAGVTDTNSVEQVLETVRRRNRLLSNV